MYVFVFIEQRRPNLYAELYVCMSVCVYVGVHHDDERAHPRVRVCGPGRRCTGRGSSCSRPGRPGGHGCCLYDLHARLGCRALG